MKMRVACDFFSVLLKSREIQDGGPLYDKDLEENSLGCVMKSRRLKVSNELNTPRVMGMLASKAPPPSPHPPSVKKTPLKKSVIRSE